ncbi:MAG: two-component system, OmpR family, sensor kinase [Thermotogaceae bacterium]|jgi:two-component system OmpR family sensor kinase|nr:two-component system, OmpR family, sensor kinase [Thermotogaceae bacterium]
MEETSNSINRFLITIASFARELNTAKNTVDISKAIEKVMGRFFSIESSLTAMYKDDEWQVIRLDDGFPISETDMENYYSLALERKSPSFFPLNDSDYLVILPSVKSGRLLSTFFGYVGENEKGFTQEFETMFGFFSFYSGIVLENLDLLNEVKDAAKVQEQLRVYFEMMLNSLDEGICVLDSSGEFVFKNKKYREIDPGDAVVEQIKRISAETFAQNTGQAVEMEFDGVFYSFNSVILTDDDQVLLRLEDITNTKELERMKKIDQMKTEFIANISHELRTPLSAIKAYSETINDSVESLDPATLKEFMGTIIDQSDHLTFLLDQLLDFSRMERKDLNLEKSNFNIIELIKKAKESNKEKYEQHSVEIELKLPEEAVMVNADEKRIKQVLINLISNAVKYSNKEMDEKKVVVSLETEGDEVTIAVKDNGLGIEESELDKIFNKFYRIDSSLTYEVEGTGLGLAICREIIHEHGKEITVESSPGEGSVFSFKLDKAGD